MTRTVAPPVAVAHKRILASAGSGKTYQLASRYLQLVANGAEPGTILASTFTRAAAGEIRDRLLMRVVEAVEDAKCRAELGKVLDRRDLTETDVLELLTTLARNVHRMRVRTLDSFFASVVTAFSFELGIPPGSEVVDVASEVELRGEAIRLVLDESDPQPLIDLLRRLIDGADRGVTERIDKTVTGLYELSLDTAPGAWDMLPEPGGRLDAPRLADAIDRLGAADPTTDKRFIKAHTSDCAQARAHQWIDFLTGGLPKAIVAGTHTYYRKPVPDDLLVAYQPVIAHARAFLIDGIRGRATAMQRLLKRYHERFEDVKRRARALTFADLTHAMSRAGQGQMPSELGFRLDASIDHLLLDEFQDTSVGQWRALAPIATDILRAAPPARTFFSVGDVKQSIYGWRDAAPDILDRLPELIDGGDRIVDEPLHRSWRSSQVVIDVVNDVFGSLSSNAALDTFADARTTWQRWFTEHDTAKDLPGYVELRFGPSATRSEERRPARLQRAAALVADLHKRRPDLSIGVLTRSNPVEARMLYELGPAKLRIPASGRGGGPLTETPAVNAILDLLKLADHPDDTVAAFNVAHSPLAAAIEAKPPLSTSVGRADRLRLARRMRRRLLDDGFGKTIGGWATRLISSCDEREARRLLQLVELAERFDANPSLRADDFIDFVEATRVPERRPAPVQVMTVHQAKGLEFDIVVLPELESRLTGATAPDVLFERDEPTGPITRISPSVKKELRPLVPELDSLYEQHEARMVRESLCLLYVAMTRAKQGLYMLIDPPAANEGTTPKTVASVLRQALAHEAVAPDSTIYTHGDPRWIDAPAEEKMVAAAPAPIVTPIRLATGGPQVRFGTTVAPPSAHQSPAAVAAQLRLPDTDAQDRGTAIHALLEQVEWIEDWSPDEAELRDVLYLALPHRDDAWCAERRAELDGFLRHEAVRLALSRRDRPASRLQLHREHPFARLVETRLQRGTIDRLEVELNESGDPVRACVIDFKTDRVEASQADAAAEGYRGQLEIYRDATMELLGIEAASIELVVLFVGPGVAVGLES